MTTTYYSPNPLPADIDWKRVESTLGLKIVEGLEGQGDDREQLADLLAQVEVSEDHMLVTLGEPFYCLDEQGSEQMADAILASPWLASRVAAAVADARERERVAGFTNLRKNYRPIEQPTP